MAKVDYIQEQAVDVTGMRSQMNTARALNEVNDRIDNSPVLISEQGELGRVKQYGNQEYEVYHGLGFEASSIGVAYSNGLVSIYVVTESNPQNVDRSLYIRIRVVPLKINGAVIETDSSKRSLRFWVN